MRTIELGSLWNPRAVRPLPPPTAPALGRRAVPRPHRRPERGPTLTLDLWRGALRRERWTDVAFLALWAGSAAALAYCGWRFATF